MGDYRLLERLSDGQEWLPEGVAYIEDDLCLLYRLGQTTRLGPAAVFPDLADEHFPYERGKKFRWTQVKQWGGAAPFSPESALEARAASEPRTKNVTLYVSVEQLPPDLKQYLRDLYQAWDNQHELRFKQIFIDLYEAGRPPFRELVESLWRRSAVTYGGHTLFDAPEHNVSLLLYARCFGLPVNDNPVQTNYLAEHQDLYAPLVPDPPGYGARAALSKNVLAMLDAPVTHVWLYSDEGTPQRIVIAGKGLAEHSQQMFLDALTTAMRVQASNRDLLNVGLISIERMATLDQALDISLPVLGADAPLADADTADAAMREIIRQLRKLELDTGFVEVHEIDIGKARDIQETLGRLAREAMNSGTKIVWAPDPSAFDDDEEVVTIQPILRLTGKGQRGGTRGVAPPASLSLNPELLNAAAWQKLMQAYHTQVIRGVEMDARIRLEYYERRGAGLKAEKEQWDTADEQQRSQRWGPTVTLNQRFDDKLGLAIWLHPPTVISITQYFEENVPGLIRSYEEWATKMRGILASIAAAASRPDLPFFRLLATRLFDAALRGREPELGEGVRKFYQDWAGPAADLLRFEWRKKLSSLKARPEDLFTTHTSFGLSIFASGRPTRAAERVIERVEMVPYTLLDAKRSVVLFDRDRGVMIVKDSSDFPQQPAQPSAGDDWEELLRQSEGPGAAAEAELAERLRRVLIADPQAAGWRMISLLSPHLGETALPEDAKHIGETREQGLRKTTFTRHVNLADHAMDGRAVLTTRENLDGAHRAVRDLLKTWQAAREAATPMGSAEPPAPLPEAEELECRLHLMMAVGECLAAGHSVKDYLPTTFRSPQAGGKPEIRDALSRAEQADRAFAHGWIERLSHWGLSTAYSELTRGLPSEEELTTREEHAAMLAFDAIELINVTKILHEAIRKLSQTQERRASTLAKLGPALEAGFLMQAASTVHGDFIRLLEVLSGRQAAFGSGVER